MVGRWLCSLIFELSLANLLTFITTEILSLLFAIVVLSLAKNADGVIEDQKHYLLRLEEERKKEQQSNTNEIF